MGIININLDDKSKSKLEIIVAKKGFKSINEYILKTIENELNDYEDFFQVIEELSPQTEHQIIKTLMLLSERLSELKQYDEKVKFLSKFDSFFKKNKEIIKEKCPDLLVSVLNSL